MKEKDYHTRVLPLYLCLLLGWCVAPACSQVTESPLLLPDKPDEQLLIEQELRVEDALRYAAPALPAPVQQVQTAKPLSHPVSTTSLPGTSLFFATGSNNASLPRVVPQRHMEPAMMMQLHEDLTVMTRILENRGVGRAQVTYRNQAFDLWDGPNNPYMVSLLGFNAHSVSFECTYLEDYGLLFSGSVAMPLYPTQEVVEPEPSSDRDEVWEAALEEIRNPDVRRKSRTNRQKNPQESPRYDEDACLALQQSLADSLKHARNIRHQEGIKRISMVIRGHESVMIMHVDFPRILDYAEGVITYEQYWEAFKVIRYRMKVQTTKNNHSQNRTYYEILSDSEPQSSETPGR